MGRPMTDKLLNCIQKALHFPHRKHGVDRIFGIEDAGGPQLIQVASAQLKP